MNAKELRGTHFNQDQCGRALLLFVIFVLIAMTLYVKHVADTMPPLNLPPIHCRGIRS